MRYNYVIDSETYRTSVSRFDSIEPITSSWPVRSCEKPIHLNILKMTQLLPYNSKASIENLNDSDFKRRVVTEVFQCRLSDCSAIWNHRKLLLEDCDRQPKRISISTLLRFATHTFIKTFKIQKTTKMKSDLEFFL